MHKYTAQNSVRTSKAISESTENSVRILSQKSFNDSFKDFILLLSYVYQCFACTYICACAFVVPSWRAEEGVRVSCY